MAQANTDRYPRFDIARGALSAEPYRDKALHLVGESLILSPINPEDWLGMERRRRVALNIVQFEIVAAQLVADPDRVHSIDKAMVAKARQRIKKGNYFVNVSEADQCVNGESAVVELEELAVIDEQGEEGLLVNGLTPAGVLLPAEGRILYEATRYNAIDRPPDSHYVPYVR